MLGMNSCGGSDPGLSAAFDLRYVTVASQSAGRLRRDGRLYRSHQRDVFSCSSKFLADYNYNGVLTRYKARRRLSHSSRHSFLIQPPIRSPSASYSLRQILCKRAAAIATLSIRRSRANRTLILVRHAEQAFDPCRT